eukprot:6188004-Pleurochrysis_carterae.AAC.8
MGCARRMHSHRAHTYACMSVHVRAHTRLPLCVRMRVLNGTDISSACEQAACSLASRVLRLRSTVRSARTCTTARPIKSSLSRGRRQPRPHEKRAGWALAPRICVKSAETASGAPSPRSSCSRCAKCARPSSSGSVARRRGSLCSIA